jgi:hypothetical protein
MTVIGGDQAAIIIDNDICLDRMQRCTDCVEYIWVMQLNDWPSIH